MSEPSTRLELQKAALELRASNPSRWGEFCNALAAYSTHVTTSCVTSPVDALPVMQGRARMMLELLDTLRNASKSVEVATRLRTPTP